MPWPSAYAHHSSREALPFGRSTPVSSSGGSSGTRCQPDRSYTSTASGGTFTETLGSDGCRIATMLGCASASRRATEAASTTDATSRSVSPTSSVSASASVSVLSIAPSSGDDRVGVDVDVEQDDRLRAIRGLRQLQRPFPHVGVQDEVIEVRISDERGPSRSPQRARRVGSRFDVAVAVDDTGGAVDRVLLPGRVPNETLSAGRAVADLRERLVLVGDGEDTVRADTDRGAADDVRVTDGCGQPDH